MDGTKPRSEDQLWPPLSILAALGGYLMAPVRKAVDAGFFTGGAAKVNFAVLSTIVGGLIGIGGWIMGGRNAVEQQTIRIENHSVNHDKQMVDILKRLEEVEKTNIKTYGEIQVINRVIVYTNKAIEELARDLKTIKERR